MTLDLHRLLATRLTSTVTVWAFTGMNSRGDRTFATSASKYPARLEALQHFVQGKDGRDVLAKSRCFVGPTTAGTAPTITVEDKVQFPDGTQPILLAVDTGSNRDGTTNHQLLHA